LLLKNNFTQMAFTPDNIIILNETDPKFAVSGVLVTSGGVGTIAAGTPSKSADAAASATGAVVPMVDGDGTIAQNFTGIAKSTSTDTAAADGSVTLWLPLPGYVYAAKAKTASTADTAAEVQALFRKRVVFDLTSSTWTVDAAAADALVNCVTIVGGDYQTRTLWFTYKNGGTMLGQEQTS
jgi:hypothetical protein